MPSYFKPTPSPTTRATIVPQENADAAALLADGFELLTDEEIQARLALIPEIEPTVEAAPVPESIGPAQLRIALRHAGVDTAAVTAAINAIPDTTARADAQDLWEYATAIRRDHPIISQLASRLGLSAAQVDAIFVAGSGI